MRKKYLFLSLFCCLFFIFSVKAQSTIYVNSANVSGTQNGLTWATAFSDFQAGVNAATTGDNVFVAKGTYQPPSGQSFAMKEGVKIYGGFAGTETSLSQRNLATSNSSILKGNGSRVIFNSTNNLTVTAVLDGFTITGGNISSGGGGIENYQSSPTITNCIFSGNTAGVGGGGMFNYISSPTIINCIFSGNSAGVGGGGMYNVQSSSPTVINCTFSGNTAGSIGGGMYNAESSPIITNCTFSGNTANISGGGMYNLQSSLAITNTIFWGNTAGTSADIYQNDGTLAINYSYTQTTQSGTGNITGSSNPFVNSSNPVGADGVFGTADDGLELATGSAAINAGDPQTNQTSYAVQAGNTDITGNLRIVGDRVDMGAYEEQCRAVFWMTGIHEGYDTTKVTYTFTYPDNKATIFQAAPIATGTIDPNSTFVSSNTAIASVNSNGSLSLNGIGKCTITATTSGGCTAFCNIIVNRPTVKPDADGIVYVDGSEGPGDGSSWAKAVDSLHIALSAATGNPAIKQIWVAKGTYQPTAGNSFSMKEGVKIYGGFAGTETSLSQRNLAAGNSSILKGNGNSVINNIGNGLTAAAVLDGFTITDGNASNGGGMNNSQSSPTITNCIFSGNTSSGGGGGMYNLNSSPTVTNCIFSGNKADTGGGMENSLSSSPNITNCTFSGNTAFNLGGGMENDHSASPNITNCTFSGNTVTYFGGGMYNGINSSSSLTNSIFWGNTASTGADIYQHDRTLTINYSFTQTTQTGTGNITGSSDPFVNSSNPAGADGVFGTADDGLKLITGSAAINTGDPKTNNTGYAVQAGNTDIAGNPRILNGRIDIGAYEKQTTIYVNSANVSGTQDGLSWATAYNNFQVAVNSATAGDSVFVAGGTYQTPPFGRPFSMKEGVKIYGGFAGSETSLNQRNLAAGNNAILKNDGLTTGRSVIENLGGITAAAVLDGFIITGGGNATYGGGMSNYQSSPTITNCIFSGNTALVSGGGMYNSESSPIIMNCIFSGNRGPDIGGGMYNESSSPIVQNCTFWGNIGGGIFSSFLSHLTIQNSIFWGNSDFGISGTNNPGFPETITVSNSITQGYDAGNNGNINADPLFVNTSGGDFHLLPGSPAINAGNNAALPTSIITDLAGNPRIYDKANGGIVDMGAYEYPGNPEPPLITMQPSNTTVCDNASATFGVTATGATLTYQWQSSSDGTNWENVNDATSDNLSLAIVTMPSGGSLYRVILNNVWGSDTSNAATLTVNPLPDITITADNANPVSKGILTHLTASGADSYQWSDGPGIQGGSGDAILAIRPGQDATYTVTGTSAKGCTAQQNYDVKIVTDYKLICNNIVSPNGDGKNDTWIIQNVDSYQDNKVIIFDRAGRKVYERNNYDNQWNGTLNGKLLPEGTYYYVFLVDGGKKTFKGYIELLTRRP